ncbi:ribonuclease inhibitor-like protein [Leptomonas seymouri]|uniref:Ribonuclease inhibitor-like protein n=1 Tax=Leptomonas seymouri TaxID=5684 RepID=A0A0N1I557_LEPSE|nr:ribonuclease inhibitor-like protein [Leptomonas seymouri]|eukprot:KPI87734.1 ribonuclease inhibitor-like protein [Leptomonas seymouri]
MEPNLSASASVSRPFPAAEGNTTLLPQIIFQASNTIPRPAPQKTYEAQLYNFKCTKGSAFLQDREAAVTSLPRLLPDGIPYAANFVSFDDLRECGALNETHQNDVSITAEDLRLLYEARCLDQGLPPSWKREVRFMELVSAKCKGNFFCLPENGFGVNSAEALAAILSSNRRYSVLDLSGNRLRDEGARFIAQLIKQNLTLVHIDVASNDIGHVGGVLIARALLENNTVVSLDIGARAGVNGNHIGTPGAEALGAVLRSNEVLARLNVSSNGLGAGGVAFIASALGQNHSLTRLNLSRNSLGPEGAQILAAVLEESQVTHWELPRNHLDDKGGAVFLEALVDAVRNGHDVVEYLDMEDNGLGTTSAEAVGKLLSSSAALSVLRLADNALEGGIKAISTGLHENHSLATLSLCTCNVDQSGAAALGHALASNHTLLHLDISNNHIKDAGAVDLAKGLGSNKCLLSCNLASNKIGHEGGLEIARAVQKNTTLRHLNLRRNMMIEATGDAISDALRVNKSVERMDVAYNDFSYVCVMAIERALERNKVVNKALLVPKLQRDIDILAPKEKELDRAEEDIELEKRMVRDRGEELIRRGEEARVVSEKLRREIAELNKVYEKTRAATDAAEDTLRQTENRVNAAIMELKTKRMTMETRIQQEKERTDRFQRDTEKLRKQIKLLEDAEREQLGPLFKDLESTERDRTREMEDAKFEAEKLATLEIRLKERQIATNKRSKKKT